MNDEAPPACAAAHPAIAPVAVTNGANYCCPHEDVCGFWLFGQGCCFDAIRD